MLKRQQAKKVYRLRGERERAEVIARFDGHSVGDNVLPPNLTLKKRTRRRRRRKEGDKKGRQRKESTTSSRPPKR